MDVAPHFHVLHGILEEIFVAAGKNNDTPIQPLDHIPSHLMAALTDK